MEIQKYHDFVKRFGVGSSFAIWGNTVSDMSVFSDEAKPWGKINAPYVIVAINPAVEVPESLENFHSPKRKHHDNRLAEAIRGTKLEGSFMTDCSRTITPNSSKVNVDGRDIVGLKKKIDAFEAALGEKIKGVILLTTAQKYDQWQIQLESAGYRVARFLHYGGQNGNAIKKACEQYGLIGSSGDEKYINVTKALIDQMPF